MPIIAIMLTSPLPLKADLEIAQANFPVNGSPFLWDGNLAVGHPQATATSTHVDPVGSITQAGDCVGCDLGQHR